MDQSPTPTALLPSLAFAPAVAPSSERIPCDLLTVVDAAARLGVGKTAVYSLIRRRDIAHLRIGRSVRLREADVAAYLLSSRVEARDRRRYGRYPQA